MKRMIRGALAALALLIGTAAAANAQSACKYITGDPDNVLTASQWNWCFQQKNDAIGFAPLNAAGGVLTGKLTTAPASASGSGLSLPNGTAPISPNDGDIWTTSSGLYFQSGGATIGPVGVGLPTSASANMIAAGPATGSPAAPTFRSLVAADLPVATGSAFGAVKPDGTTITISSGVISAAGAAATTIQSGVTNFTSATSGNCAYNNVGILGNKPCITQVKIVPFNAASGAITYTPTAGLVYAKIECVGGGGAGGGANSGATTTAGGGGGGAGAYSEVIASAATIGASQSGSIGAGGTGSTGAGTAGGDTNLGTLCVAKGGGGGAMGVNSGGNGGLGGAASGGTGDVKFDGNGGQAGLGATGTNAIAISGAGAGSFFGGGGRSITLSGAGPAATACGGGAGGATITLAASNAGGAGFRGCIIITEFINN